MNEPELNDDISLAQSHCEASGAYSFDPNRTHTNTKSVLNRLSRAIGHLTSVRGMIEEGRDCAEVLIQLSAVRSALKSTCEVILKDHLESCIIEAIKTGDTDAIGELNNAIELLMK